ncbi:MAG: SGNH/GDSL hydrolase family protein [Chitinophagaceae bacterium]|nr:MAG: SGNH/GDSL hydrolase family protein [Chitinophagaceae bacterium]
MNRTRIIKLRLLLLLMIMSGINSFSKAQVNKSPIRESIEWLDVWMPNTNDTALPRILLIGNSITRGYYQEVQTALTNKAYVARLTTSKSLGDPGLLLEIGLILDYYKFDIVHFNNGLHGWGYTEKQYGDAFPGLIKTLRRKAPAAKLMWATTTPIRDKTDIKGLDPRTERIKERNKITLEIISRQKDISIDDLWGFTINNPEFFEGGDGTHPNKSGYQQIGQKVAAELSSLITETRSNPSLKKK